MNTLFVHHTFHVYFMMSIHTSCIFPLCHACFMLIFVVNIMLCLSYGPFIEACSLNFNFATLNFSPYPCMSLPCCSIFSMLEPLFLIKQNTIVFYSFQTWTLIFTSLHLEPWVVRYVGWKLDEISLVFTFFSRIFAWLLYVCMNNNVWRSVSRRIRAPASHLVRSFPFCLLVALMSLDQLI